MPCLKLKYAISTGLMEVQKQSIFSGAGVKIDSKELTCVAKFWDKLEKKLHKFGISIET